MHDAVQQPEQAMACVSVPMTSTDAQESLAYLCSDWECGPALAAQLLKAVSVLQS